MVAAPAPGAKHPVLPVEFVAWRAQQWATGRTSALHDVIRQQPRRKQPGSCTKGANRSCGLHKQGGVMQTVLAISAQLHLPRSGAGDRFDAGGWAAIRPARDVGRWRGVGRASHSAQSKFTQRMIIDHRPGAIEDGLFLWSRAAVAELIQCEYGIRPQPRRQKYLARWLCAQRLKRALLQHEQKPEAVRGFSKGENPGIEKRACAEGAEIHWGDETALANTDVRGAAFAENGTSARSCP